MVGLDGHASLSAGRAPWRDGQAFLPLRRRPEGNVCRRRRQNDAACTALSASDHRVVDRRTQHHPLSAASKHPSDAGPSWGPQSMMRHLAGLRWQSQRRRRRPSGQRRPSTKPSRGRAWVTHTAPKQPSLPSAEDGRAAWGPPAAAAARTMPMLRNAFEPFVIVLVSYTVRMSLAR